jgi:hypothetical protein
MKAVPKAQKDKYTKEQNEIEQFTYYKYLIRHGKQITKYIND